MGQEASNAKKDAAYHTFKRSIIDFTFPPGALLTEEFLAEKFKISRTPIRDAILKLQQDGCQFTFEAGTHALSVFNGLRETEV